SAARLACPLCGALCPAPSEVSITSSPTPALDAPTRIQADFSSFSGRSGLSTGAGLAVIPGYEILTKLGHGGMGVVFKAVQTSLHRVVALKMVLGCYDDNPAQLARFQIEAEALATLQHPNIVQVYDVGTHDGSPFFSMEFVDGGSLAQKLAGKAQPA